MGKQRYFLLVIMALVSGLVGGMISNQLLVDRPAFAGLDNTITAEKFVLADKGGIRGLWATDKGGNVSLTLKSTVGDIVLIAGDQGNLLRIDAGSGTVGLQVEDNRAGLFLIDRNGTKRGEFNLQGSKVTSKLMGNAGQVLWSAPKN